MRPSLIATCLLIAIAGSLASGADATPPTPAPQPAPAAQPHERVYLGITAKEQDGQAQGLDIFPPAVVGSVSAGSNADRLGIKVGDTITALNGHAVANMGELVQALSQVAPGDPATVVVTRDGKPLTVSGTFQGGQPGGGAHKAKAATSDDGAVMP